MRMKAKISTSRERQKARSTPDEGVYVFHATDLTRRWGARVGTLVGYPRNYTSCLLNSTLFSDLGIIDGAYTPRLKAITRSSCSSTRGRFPPLPINSRQENSHFEEKSQPKKCHMSVYLNFGIEFKWGVIASRCDRGLSAFCRFYIRSEVNAI